LLKISRKIPFFVNLEHAYHSDNMFFKEMRKEFEGLFEQNGIRGLVLITRTGEVLDSWLKEDDLREDVTILNLIEATRIFAPAMLSYLEMGIKRAIFFFDETILLFSNVVGRAYLVCLLKEEFNYISVVIEADRAAYIIGKYLLNQKIDPSELEKFLRNTFEQTSSLISSSTRTLRNNIKERILGKDFHG